jgi:uracil-DNA glycosylase family 4
MADRETAAHHLKQHLDRLQSAGVEFLPAPNRQLPPPVAETKSLFEEVSVEPAAPEMMDRRVALAVLTEEVKGCVVCGELASTRSQTVFGVGPVDAELCFIGEAPGADEDRQGEPFVGAAGQLLNKIIAACGMKREEVYICNILRCRPPGNRTPRADEAANCRSFLDRTLELIRPKYICCLGACAAQNLLGVTTSIGKMRGKSYDYNGMTVVCTYHPSYLLRSETPEPKRLVWEDMQRLLTKMGKPIPQHGKK